MIITIKDETTKLSIAVEKNDDDGQLMSVTFFGTQELIHAIVIRLGFFEQLTYSSGHRLSVGFQKNSDNSITIHKNIEAAINFITEDQYIPLNPKTLNKLSQALHSTPLVSLESPGVMAGLSRTLFHRRTDQTTPLIPQPPINTIQVAH